MTNHDTPTCNHCGTQMEHDEMWADSNIEKGDCDDSEVVCSNSDCGKTFYVRCTHEIFFFNIDADGDELY